MLSFGYPAIMVDENGATKDKSRAATAVRKCILSSLVHIHTYAHKPLTNSPTSHYNDVTMSAISSQITSLTIVYSTVYSDVDQRKHQSSASLAFVRGIHRSPVNSPHKGPRTRKMTSSCTILWIRLRPLDCRTQMVLHTETDGLYWTLGGAQGLLCIWRYIFLMKNKRYKIRQLSTCC